MKRNTLSPEELSIIKDEAAWEEAKQNALREGRAEGRAEGEREKAREIAKAMLINNADKVFIAQVTGLLLTEIEQIKLT